MSIELGPIAQVVQTLGVAGMLIVVLYGGIKRWWVFGWHYDEVLKERNEWKQLALGGTSLAQRAVSLAEQKAGP